MASSEHLKELVAKQEAAAVQISAVESAKDVQRQSRRQLNLGSNVTSGMMDSDVQYNLGSDPNKTHIKDQIRNHAADIQAHGIVADYDVNSNDFSNRYTSTVSAINALSNRFGTLYRQDIGNVEMSKRNITGVFAYLKSRGEWASVLAVPDVI